MPLLGHGLRELLTVSWHKANGGYCIVLLCFSSVEIYCSCIAAFESSVFFTNTDLWKAFGVPFTHPCGYESIAN